MATSSWTPVCASPRLQLTTCLFKSGVNSTAYSQRDPGSAGRYGQWGRVRGAPSQPPRSGPQFYATAELTTGKGERQEAQPWASGASSARLFWPE